MRRYGRLNNLSKVKYLVTWESLYPKLQIVLLKMRLFMLLVTSCRPGSLNESPFSLNTGAVHCENDHGPPPLLAAMPFATWLSSSCHHGIKSIFPPLESELTTWPIALANRMQQNDVVTVADLGLKRLCKLEIALLELFPAAMWTSLE